MKGQHLAMLSLAIAFSIWPLAVEGQCNPTCQGDFDGDGHVTIEEILTSVSNALYECTDGAQQACLESGGAVTSGLCCTGVGAFPNTCAIGPCGCAPQFSSPTQVCNCGDGRCFNGSSCVSFLGVTAQP